jgi:hypothetical protein
MKTQAEKLERIVTKTIGLIDTIDINERLGRSTIKYEYLYRKSAHIMNLRYKQIYGSVPPNE